MMWNVHMEPKEQAMVELVAALEKATQMTKHLPYTTDPSQIHQIHASLHAAHHHLTMFLHNQPPPPPPEKSTSSAVAYGGVEAELFKIQGDELMEVVDEEVGTEVSCKNLDGVEVRLKDWSFVQNKRPKRLLSLSAAEQQKNEVVDGGSEAVGGGGEAVEFDPPGKKSRALDLIYQFHS